MEVKSVSVEFFKDIVIEGVYVEDLHKDTLIYLDKITVNISNFDYKKQAVDLKDITIENAKASIVYYKNDTDLNFQFIKDAFKTKKDTTKKDTSGWKVTFGDIFLKNIDFTYRDERRHKRIKRNWILRICKLHRCERTFFSKFNIMEDTISARINELFCKMKKSGFALRKLSANNARISPVTLKLDSLLILTDESDIRTNLLFTYKEYDDYNDFVHKIKNAGEVLIPLMFR